VEKNKRSLVEDIKGLCEIVEQRALYTEEKLRKDADADAATKFY
jgi:hypothetical protein